MKNDRTSISQKTVSNAKRKIGLQRNSVEKIKFSRSGPVAIQSLVCKVIKQIDVENPPIQRSIAKSCHASQSTISKTIKRSNFTLRRKQKLHCRTSKNVGDVHVNFISN